MSQLYHDVYHLHRLDSYARDLPGRHNTATIASIGHANRIGTRRRKLQGMLRAVALEKLTLPLKGMHVDPEVARRLPFDLACRYQALPIAEDDGYLTVAMAHPNDVEARQAILAALPDVEAGGQGEGQAGGQAGPLTGICAKPVLRGETSVYLVRGEPAAIDSLLADVWPGRARRALRLLVMSTPSAEGKSQGQADLRERAQALGRLLGATLVYVVGDDEATADRETAQDWPGRSRKVLLVVQGDDEPAGPAALDWAIRLAQPSGAVTMLAVAPPGSQRSPSAGEDGKDGVQVTAAGGADGLTGLLTTGSSAVGQAAQRLVQGGIAGTLRLRQGLVDEQLHREVLEADYDLVVIGAKSILRFKTAGKEKASDQGFGPQKDSAAGVGVNATGRTRRMWPIDDGVRGTDDRR